MNINKIQDLVILVLVHPLYIFNYSSLSSFGEKKFYFVNIREEVQLDCGPATP